MTEKDSRTSENCDIGDLSVLSPNTNIISVAKIVIALKQKHMGK